MCDTRSISQSSSNAHATTRRFAFGGGFVVSGVVATSLDSDDLAKIKSPVADVAGADLFATDHSAFLACFLTVVVVVAGAAAADDAAADDAGAADGAAAVDAGIGIATGAGGGRAAIEAEPAEAAGPGRRSDEFIEDEEPALTCPRSMSKPRPGWSLSLRKSPR